MLASGILYSSPWLRIRLIVGAAQGTGESELWGDPGAEYQFQKSPAVTSSQDSGTETLPLTNLQTGDGRFMDTQEGETLHPNSGPPRVV